MHKIEKLVSLGLLLKDFENQELKKCFEEANSQNPWFTLEQIQFAVNQIVDNYLQKDRLKAWVTKYLISNIDPKVIAMVLAGNIPLVGFHDVLCGYVTNHNLQIKLSEKDQVLLPYIIKLLSKIDPAVNDQIEFVERIQNFDAVIATGSNRTGVYFETYFQKYPHIIRKNRNAVAVLKGNEKRKELEGLAQDILAYFGLGCRNVSKIYIPQDYDLQPLLAFLHEYNEIILHHKYKNNFDYNYALFMLNKDTFFINGTLLLKEDSRIASRIASVHYERYDSIPELIIKLQDHREEIQCVCSSIDLAPVQTLAFGDCQRPDLDQYADGVDTMQFLTSL